MNSNSTKSKLMFIDRCKFKSPRQDRNNQVALKMETKLLKIVLLVKLYSVNMYLPLCPSQSKIKVHYKIFQ